MYNSYNDSVDSDMWDPIGRCRKISWHKHIPHAYISIVIDPCNLVQLGTPCLLALTLVDDYIIDILGFFVESYIEDLGDIIDDIHLLFDEDYPSLVVTREHSDPLIHSLHNQSFKVDMIMDTYV